MTPMLPQPPPDAPIPPPSEAALRSLRWWYWVLSLGILSASVVLAAIMAGVFLVGKRGGPGHEFVRAINHMKLVGIALFTFKDDFGTYPDDTEIPKLLADHPGNTIPLGTTTANDYFRQLLVSEIVDDERIFVGSPGKRPDGRIDGGHALETGECVFAYLPDASDSYYCPIVVYPLVKGKLLFDYKLCETWGEQAAVLFTDNSVVKIHVDSSGRGYFNGKDFFDPSQPYWNGRKPDVKWPE